MLPTRRYLLGPGDVVLLSEGDDTVRDLLLQQRRSLRRLVQRILRLPCGQDPVWERREPDVLPCGPGMWRFLPFSVDLRPRRRMYERDFDNDLQAGPSTMHQRQPVL
jgi:hypothetical protein